MKTILAVISMLCCLEGVWGQDLRGILTPSEDAPLRLEEGDTFLGALELMPQESFDHSGLRALDGYHKSSEHLQFIDIQDVSLSENNADVVVVKGRLVVKKGANGDHVPFQIQGHPLQVELRGLTLVPSGRQAPEKMSVAEQPYHWKDSLPVAAWVLMASIAAITTILGSRLGRKAWKVRKAKKQLLDKRAAWAKTFHSATTREDFERIYMSREEWLPLFPVGAPGADNFFQRIRPHLYKREWSELDMHDVRAAFGGIKGSFDQEGR